jgi:hypothetical protein
VPKQLQLINISSLPTGVYKLLVNVALFSSCFFSGFWAVAKNSSGLGYALGRFFHGTEKRSTFTPCFIADIGSSLYSERYFESSIKEEHFSTQ